MITSSPISIAVGVAPFPSELMTFFGTIGFGLLGGMTVEMFSGIGRPNSCKFLIA